MHSLPLKKFKYPPFPFKKIVAAHIFVRGTSTEFSRKGNWMNAFGVPPDLPKNRWGWWPIPAYHVPPQASSHSAWSERFNATIHAAIERALSHSHLIDPLNIENPAHLPVIVFAVRPSLKLVSIGKLAPFVDLSTDVPAGRQGLYEQALVGGEPKQTFRETDLFPYDFTEGMPRLKVFRVTLTRKEYKAVLREARERAEKAGHDFTAMLNKKRVSLKPSRREWSLVRDTLGHSLPIELRETGQHAWNPITYYVGEHVKKALLKKAYEKLKQSLASQSRKASEGD